MVFRKTTLSRDQETGTIVGIDNFFDQIDFSNEERKDSFVAVEEFNRQTQARFTVVQLSENGNTLELTHVLTGEVDLISVE